jgi:hypothetical protein
LTFDAATRTFSGTPTLGTEGVLDIRVFANDGNGGIKTDRFSLTINQMPTVSSPIPDQVATEDSAFSFQFGAGAFNDADGNALTYTATLADNSALPSWLTFDSNTRTFSGTPVNSDVGSIAVKVSANDGFTDGTVSDTFDIVVANTNDAPTVANAIPNQNATENSPFNFQFAANTFADVDANTTLVYSAQLANGDALPAWLGFDPATLSFSGTPGNGDIGNLTIRIIASDGIANVSAQFQLTVITVNDAPVTSGIPSVNNLEDSAGNTLDLLAAFSDEETPSNQLKYTVVSNSNPALVSGATIDSATGKLQLNYGANQFGIADLVIRAQDAQGASVETSLRVNIESVNDTPVSTGISDVRVQAGASPQQMNLQSRRRLL